MEPIPAFQSNHEELTRRRLIRKAAYTAPVVVVIAAAPHTALGASGPRRKEKSPSGPVKNPGPKKNK